MGHYIYIKLQMTPYSIPPTDLVVAPRYRGATCSSLPHLPLSFSISVGREWMLCHSKSLTHQMQETLTGLQMVTPLEDHCTIILPPLQVLRKGELWLAAKLMHRGEKPWKWKDWISWARKSAIWKSWMEIQSSCWRLWESWIVIHVRMESVVLNVYITMIFSAESCWNWFKYDSPIDVLFSNPEVLVSIGIVRNRYWWNCHLPNF